MHILKLFQFINYEVVVDPVAWTLQPFHAILEKYKKKDKYYATLEMAYIFYSADWQSDYASMTDVNLRKEKILSDIFLKDKNKLKIDELTDVAIAYYKEMQETISMGLYEDAKTAVNKIRDYFTTVDLTLLDDNGKPLYDISKLTKAISDTATIVNKLKELEDAVKKEVSESSNIRGVDKIGLFE